MKFGYFDDARKEYVITTPYTPYPWINYLGNKDYFALISNTAGGYSFYKDARKRRITRYRYNSVPVDNEGKYFFIKDGETIWNPGVKPTKTEVDHYECRHGMGYTNITSIKNEVQVSQLSFVPIGFHGEIHQIKIKNNSSITKELSLFSYLEWHLWDALDDMTNFQRNFNIGEVEVENNTIYHKTEYKERRNHYAFYHVNHDIDGFDTDRENFVGLYNSISNPDVVVQGKSKNSIASGWSPIASHSIKIAVAPQEEKSFVFILGYVENTQEDKFIDKNIINKEKAYQMQERFKTDQDVNDAIEELSTYWEDILGKFQITTEHEPLNRMVNIWNAYQNMTCFNLSRSASYFESGVGRGMGFRDSNQDVLGFVHQSPSRARERLIDLISTQLYDGGAYHQYSPLTKKGNTDLGTGFNDDPNWMVLSVAAYVRETGDLTILDELAPYGNRNDVKETILEHVKRAFQFTINNLGPHNLPLIGRADWNDCLNLNCFSEAPGESFQTVQNKGDGLTAESIFIAGLFVYVAKDFKGLLDFIKDPYGAAVEQHIQNMEQAVIEHGYDKEWFLRAYDAFGNKVGSVENEEGKIFIEPQGMCIMAGIGIQNGLAEKALHSAEKYLDTDYGMVLNYPAYTKYHVELGEISSYPIGYKENGGIFCHNNPWVMAAYTMVKNGERAFEMYKKIAPAYIEDISEIHRTEPYVYAQMIAGKEAVRHGEAKNSWLTGTASWNYVAITQYILGIKAEYEGLKIYPVIPKDFGVYQVVRKFRNSTYNIRIDNTFGNDPDNMTIIVNGISVKGNVIPLPQKSGIFDVTVKF